MAFGKNGEVVLNVQGAVLRHPPWNLGMSPLPGLAWNDGLYLLGRARSPVVASAGNRLPARFPLYVKNSYHVKTFS